MSTEPRDVPQGKRPVPARSWGTWIAISVVVIVALVIVWLAIR